MSEIESKTAQIVISRNADNDIKMRSLELFVDDVFADSLPFDSTYSSEINPGDHTIKVTNRLYTRRLKVSAKPGETLNLQIGNYFDGLGGIMMSVIGFGHYKCFVKQIPSTPGPA